MGLDFLGSLGRFWTRAWIAVAFFAFLPSPDAHAQESISFEHVTAEDGLPHNWVSAVYKDRRGFIWVGTQDGVARYDAAGTFTVWRRDSAPGSLPFSPVKVMLEDSRKGFWIGSFWGGGGLARRDPDTGQFESFMSDGTPKTPGAAEIRDIVEDGDGRIWLATNGGLDLYDPATKIFTMYMRSPDVSSQMDSVLSLAVDGRRLWVGTSLGLARFNLDTRAFEDWADRPDDPLLQAEVWDLLLEKGGALWAATLTAGVFRVQTTTGRTTRYAHDPRDPNTISTNRARVLATDGKGRLFIGTENGGLDILQTATGAITHHMPDFDNPRSLSSTSIYALYYDDQDILWIGTFNGGINLMSPAAQRFQTFRARRGGLSDPHVSAVLEDQLGRLWVGMDGGGLNRLDRKTGRWTYYRHDAGDPRSLGSDAILALAQEKSGRLWVGGWDAGLAYYDPPADRFVGFRHRDGDPQSLISDHIFTILPLSTGEILVGTLVGPLLFDPRTGKVTSEVLLPQGQYGTGTCFAALEDREGKLWLAGDSRVVVVDRKAGKAIVHSHQPNDPQSLGAGRATALLQDSLGNVWVGTEEGLNVLDAANRGMRRYTVADGLPHKIVTGLLEDANGNLWVATNRGLARLDDAVHVPTTPSLLVFDTHDGLQGTEFRFGTAFQTPRGEMFFGTERGLNAFFPSRIVRNETPPPVVLTGLKLFNQPVAIGAPGSPLRRPLIDTDRIVLDHDQSMVTIDYAALNYLLPHKNRYAYKLEGVDRDWNQVGGQRAATYPSLLPGEYVFRVRAWNNDGVLNTEGASLRIRIRPPFWQTWWFRLLVVATIAAGLFRAYRRRIEEMEERRRELETQVDLRTADLEARTADLQKEIGERSRAEAEARQYAERLAANNDVLVESRNALENENAERKRAEEKASRERDLLHALMDNIPDLIYFKDRQSRFTRINRAHAAVLGIANTVLAEGKMESDFLPRDLARSILDGEQEIFATGQPLIGRIEHDTRNSRWLLSTKVPIRDGSGEITGLVGISKDITERKQAEDRLARELAAFGDVVELASRGDLTQRGVEGQETVGHIARAVNGMLESFSKALSDVREAAFSVSSSSSEILATSKEIVKGAKMGLDQVHETSASVEEMAASMAQVSKNAQASAQKAQQVLEHVRSSDRAVDAAYEGMAKVSAAASETADKMRTLGQRSREVFEIIGLIEEISSQSKLLSLNAAIEAAHAGDAGRGFAVVAEEVRRLAEKSDEATRQVGTRIDAIVEETRSALEAMEHAMREVRAGSVLSEQARRSLAEISSIVQTSVDVSLQIAAASEQQAKSTQRVSEAMVAISDFTTGSARGADETTHAVQDLVALSRELNDAIRRFTIER